MKLFGSVMAIAIIVIFVSFWGMLLSCFFETETGDCDDGDGNFGIFFWID